MKLSELKKNADEIRKNCGEGRRILWPDDFKRIVISAYRDGHKITRLVESTGVSNPTIRSWVEEKNKSKTLGFKQIAIKEESPLSKITLHWEAGLEISGLSISDLNLLLQAELL